MAMRGALRTAIFALALSAGLAACGRAQTSVFYREESKDGRVYVFAQGSEYQRWANSGGEIGKAISRIGYGPNGETVVFDSEDAINLYNFKHDKPGEVFKKPAEAPKPVEPVARVGVTIFADYTYVQLPKDTDAAGNKIHSNAFEAKRAYINVTGNVNDFISYRVTPDVASRQSTKTTGLPSGATVSSSMDGSLTIRLKYAYGQFGFDRWSKVKGNWVRFGLQQTPWVDFIEGVYRYRFEGTIFADREGYLSSSDAGLSGHYVLPGEYGDVHAGIYNGDTYSKAEANDRKAYQARVSLRPLPHQNVLKGLRVTGFCDLDQPVHGGIRNRYIGALTFEHKHVHAGLEYLRAADRAGSARTTSTTDANGYSAWVTPRSSFGLEGLLRYDSLKPNSAVDARKNRTIVGVAYWFKPFKAPLAAAILVDYENVRYDDALGKPEEGRYAVRTLFNF